MKILMVAVMSLAFISCNSGGNGTGTATYSHNDLAQRFIYELNLDASFDIQIVKSSTKQENYIVVYDADYDTYDAVNISGFVPGTTNAADFFASTNIYYDLDYIPGYETTTGFQNATYRDRGLDLVFEKTASSSKDLAKLVSLKEAIQINKSAEFLSSEFGLSMSRGKELASLQAHWKKASKKGMTNSEVDSFSTELLGFSLSSGINAYQASLQGENNQIDSLVNQAAAVNGITPEHAGKLLTKVFGL